MSKHHDVLIVGAGTGGIMTAAQLKRKNPSLNVAIVDPSKDHHYQPAWTLVGAGAFDFKATRRDMASVIPKGVTWIQDFVTTFDPDDNVRDSDPFLSKFVDTAKENWSMWVLKKYGLPFLYWNQMMKGKM